MILNGIIHKVLALLLSLTESLAGIKILLLMMPLEALFINKE